MKRYVAPLLIVITVVIAVLIYLFVHRSNLKMDEKMSVIEVQPLCIMELPKDQIDFSPLVSAILYSHLKENDLHLTFEFSVICPPNVLLTDSLQGGFSHNGRRLTSMLSCKKKVKEGKNQVYVLQFDYNVVSLVPEMGEMGTLEYLKGMPSTLSVEDVYVEGFIPSSNVDI